MVQYTAELIHTFTVSFHSQRERLGEGAVELMKRSSNNLIALLSSIMSFEVSSETEA